MSHLYINKVDGQLFNYPQKGGLPYIRLNGIQGRAAQAITDTWERLIWWLSGAPVHSNDQPAVGFYHCPDIVADPKSPRRTCKPALDLLRVVGQAPKAILVVGKQAKLFEWADLFYLRELLYDVTDGSQQPILCSPIWEVQPRQSTPLTQCLALRWRFNDEDYEGWQINLSIGQFALLRRMLYANEELLYQGEVGKLATRPIPRQRVREAILDGRLFAIRFPECSTRQWGVPKSIAAFWAGQYAT